ncbi:hypothetical protein QQF64_003051 [Cirrhinus molitorella]|uniref:Uncharacterized protein n=1 Tax=Cirrhinus molitorella TaxID=172907 RepID=A0ABR3MIW5_9TELE
MKVHLAAQLFSGSVANAMEFCEQGLKMDEFKGFKAPVKPTTKDRAETILKQAETILCGLKDHLELFFAAIRARGGHNDNPNARQFRGAYKCLLVRHHMKTGTGNCLLRDSTYILNSTPASVNVARRLEVQLVEVSVSEDDTAPDLPGVCSLSEYKEAAISYIAGFVMKKMKEKITCLPCSQALPTDGAAHDFIHQKDRGGLQKPSPGMVSVCLTTEKCIQRRITTSGGQLPRGRGITLAISNEVLAACAEKDLFPQLHSHMFATCVEMNHIHLLVKMASVWYCKVRFNHFARRETEMAKEGKMVRRQLTKLIHFFGE